MRDPEFYNCLEMIMQKLEQGHTLEYALMKHGNTMTKDEILELMVSTTCSRCGAWVDEGSLSLHGCCPRVRRHCRPGIPRRTTVSVHPQ